MGKLAVCIYKNKGRDQLGCKRGDQLGCKRGDQLGCNPGNQLGCNHAADQCLCFRLTNNTIQGGALA